MWYTIDENHEVTPITEGRYFDKTSENEHLWRVGLTITPNYRISTVFLGLMHTGGLFETMVFDEKSDSFLELDMERCHTWDEAIEMHQKMVKKWETS